MQRRTSARVLAVCAALAMSAAACGDPEAESAASPLNELWGEPESQAEMRAKQLAQEEAVATCMKAEGWEYTPVDYTAQFNDQPEWIDPSTPGYGEKYGYGIVYGYEVYEWPYIDEDGNYAEDSPMGGGSFEDPNMEYVNSLKRQSRGR